MGDHRGVGGFLGHLDGVQGLGHGADLVQLDEDGVGHAFGDAFSQDGGVGHEHVVAHQLGAFAQAGGQHAPTVPVAFGHAVFDGDQGVLAGELGQPLGHFGIVEGLVLTLQHVLAVLIEFGSGGVDGQGHFAAGDVAGFFDGLDDVAESFVVVLQVGGKAAFVAHAGHVAVLFQQLLQHMEDLGPHAQGITEALGAQGHDHEFLDVQVVGGVGAAVDDVHHGRGQHLGVDAAQVFVQGQAQVFAGGTGAGHGHAQHGVGAQTALVVGAVQVDEGIVQLYLLQGVQAQQGVGDLAVDVLHGLGHALAAVTLAAVTQFQGLTAAGGGAGRHGRAAAVAGLQRNFHFHGRIAARIQDLAGIHRRNAAAHNRSFEG